MRAKTGSGRTAAFLLPAIQNTITKAPPKGQVSVLILSPTNEQAMQISAEAARLVARVEPPLEVHTASGALARKPALKKFIAGDPKILVATPGRLSQYLNDGDVRAKFDGMKTLVLYELDRLVDSGFLPDIDKSLRLLPSKAGGNWQGMCFSDTLSRQNRVVAENFLTKHYVTISTYVFLETYGVTLPLATEAWLQNMSWKRRALFDL